jgi:hypothetical protein
MENFTIKLTAKELLLINAILKDSSVTNMQRSTEFESEQVCKIYKDLGMQFNDLNIKIVDQATKQSDKNFGSLLTK